MLSDQSEEQSTRGHLDESADQCELEIRSDLPAAGQNVQSTLQPVGFAPKPVPYPNYAVYGGTGTITALPPVTHNNRRKKKCIIVSIISVIIIIIIAIVVPIHFHVQWMKNEPCRGIPGCQVIKSIGSGTFGDVYHVQISGAEPPDAALKVFKDVPGGSPKEVTCSLEKDSLLDIAVHEGKHHRKLQISHVREDIPVDCPRIMMEYIDGPSMDYSMTEFRGKSMSELVDVSISMMKQIDKNVLEPMHSWNIYHGDIKPGNIVYDSHHKFYAIDFGLTVSLTRLQEKRSGINAFWGGTLLFMGKDHVNIYKDLVPLQIILEDHSKEVQRAEYYSLAMSAVVFIGQNCEEPDKPLCKLGKDVMEKWNQFPPNAGQDFVKWSKGEIEDMMRPIWGLIRQKVISYQKSKFNFSGQDQKFMRILVDDWKFGEFGSL